MRFHCILPAFCLSAWFTAACAAPVVFTVDPSQSRVILSGKVAGTVIEEQGPGSLTSSFGGTLAAEVTGSTIEFAGGSALDAAVNGNWQPKPGGVAGSDPADFGGKASGLFATVYGAFRNIMLDVVSGVLPLNNGTFDASALVFSFPTGSASTLDYDLVVLKGGIPLTGIANNRVTTAATLSQNGATQKLVIQVDTEYTFKALTSNDSTVRFVGELVAVSGSSLVIGPVKFEGGKIVFSVRGATANTQIQGSADLKNWKTQEATRSLEGDVTLFAVQPAGSVEFFRAVQP
jgi:hypothetical protein